MHPDVAQSYNNLARLLKYQGKCDKAKPLYEKALEILKEVQGGEMDPWSYNNSAYFGLMDCRYRL